MKSVFEITSVDVLDQYINRMKNDQRYEEFNRKRGNGSLSAGLDMYRRYLEETGVPEEDKIKKYSPAWFREKASDYPTLDAEATTLLLDFQKRFAPSILAELKDTDVLYTIFLNDKNPDNLCRTLEFGAKIKDTFGSIKGGTSYKYGLYYSSQGSWVTGSSRKPNKLTEEEAVAVATEIRDRLVSGAEVIASFGELDTIEDYKELYSSLRSVLGADVEKVWLFGKAPHRHF